MRDTVYTHTDLEQWLKDDGFRELHLLKGLTVEEAVITSPAYVPTVPAFWTSPQGQPRGLASVYPSTVPPSYPAFFAIVTFRFDRELDAETIRAALVKHLIYTYGYMVKDGRVQCRINLWLDDWPGMAKTAMRMALAGEIDFRDA